MAVLGLWPGGKSFARDEHGGIALILALSLIPLVGTTAIAVDYARVLSVQKQLQDSLDAAVVSAAAASSRGNSNLNETLNRILTANFAAKFGEANPSANITGTSGNVVSASANVDVPMTFGQVLGVDKINVTADASAAFGLGRAEIALVLDNTGSMSGAKLDGLKAAAKDLVETLHGLPNASSQFKIGLVPFTYYVNVGMSYRSASWMNVPADYSTTTDSCWDTFPNAVYSNPRTVTGLCYNDGTSYSCSWTDYDVNWGDPVRVCGPTTSTYSWNGCVGSRSYPLDMQDTVAGINRVPGVLNAMCSSPLSRLTQSKSDIINRIDAMTANGETFIPSGLTWGWRVLSPNAPFSDGEPYSNSVRKIVVLMTDGANTKSPLYPDHEGSDSSLANALTTEVCANMKAQGISIYTVAFGVTDATINTLLASCSSGPPFTYSATTITDLQNAFRSIGEQLVAVRLAR